MKNYELIKNMSIEQLAEELKLVANWDRKQKAIAEQDEDFYIKWLNKEINVPIERLNLSVREYNCLKRAGINTSDELYQHDAETLKKVRNLSDRNIKDLIEKGYVRKDTIK